ncbi:uncharacterized protein LOC129292657 isoform X2 [Prosopis cineraria]|uniref:uncharacterized protein LOC129292657 isoform X2 n=1 Tax=Prosopis cineraria TaxID=364024 RepID=UPI0024100A81|nr:uncharacterized protein LOC129292657 isoform X2 [Prosopis cineraria]
MKTLLSNEWLPRCKRLLVSVEVTFMGEGHWTVMIYSISRSRWKLRRMRNASCAVLKNGHLLHLRYPFLLYSAVSFTNGHRAANLADSTPASVPLPLRVEPKPKSGIRQQDLLKKVVEIKPKRPKLSSPSGGNQATPVPSNASVTKREPESEKMKKKERLSLPESNKSQPSSGGSQEAEGKIKMDNPAGGLLGLAYDASSDDEE